jgi:uncharacterized membrane protein
VIPAALEEPCSPAEARERARALGLTDELVGRAAAAAVATPAPAHWRQLLAVAMGATGAGLFASGVVTFVAYNWAALGRFARFALVEALLVAAGLVAARALPRLGGQLALSVAAVLVGALLAVFGQTYQTGADPFELFLTWAVLIVPWTIAARFEPLYLLHSVVLGTGLVMAWHQLGAGGDRVFVGSVASLWALATVAIVGWEVQARRPHAVLHRRWLPRVWGALAGLALAAGAAHTIVDSTNAEGLALGAVAASVALVVWRYHLRSVDLFMQTVACGVLITVISTGLGFKLFKGMGSVELLLLVALVITGQAAAAVTWLRRAARRTRES